MGQYMIKENIDYVNSIIRKSCDKCNRDYNTAKLIAVSKTKPLDMLREAYDCGIRDFGENKVQELQEKIPNLPADIRWHMIGHLQTNKVKYIVGKVYMIHSVDSYKLAEAISKEAIKKDCIVKILIEVNIAGEETKFGIDTEDTIALVEQIAALPGIKIEGLMTIAPFTENAEENRYIFQKMKRLSVDIEDKNIDNVNMNVLSMGMTGDYSVAVEEGSTYVRVGTGIFGQRDYSNR